MLRKQGFRKRFSMVIVIMILVFLCNSTFAAETCSPETQKIFQEIGDVFLFFGSVASWVWVLLGNFAGVLMSNALIYGEAIHLDVFLRKVWQITRTFANYGIGFVFVYHIGKYLLIPSAKAESPMKVIKRLLVTSVLVQASWFLVMALVDVSTILLSTVSSFPHQVISSDAKIQSTMRSNIEKDPILGSPYKENPEIPYLDPFQDRFEKTKKYYGREGVDLNTESMQHLTKESLFDQILPQPDNLAGPLIYLGFSVFQSHSIAMQHNIADGDCLQSFTKQIINILLDTAMIILYSFALFVLVVVLIFRILYLWIFIAASPLIVFFAGTKLVEPGKISSFLDYKKIINLIFKPVIFALWVGLMTLFVVIMQGFLEGKSIQTIDQGAITVEERSVESNGSNSYTSNMKIGEMFKMTLNSGTKSLTDILLMIITMALMRYMVKLALTSKTGIQAVDNFTAGVVDTTERAIGNLPVIPTEGGAIGFKQIWNNGSSPILDARIAKGNSDLQKERQDQVNTVRSAFGWGESIAPLRVDQERSLKSAYAKSKDYRSEFVTQLQKIKNENNGIKFSEVKPLIIDWIKNTESGAALSQFEPYFGASALPIVREIYTKTNSKEGLQEGEENLLLQKLFESTGAAKTFYENVLGGTDHSVATYTMLNNPTYGDVKKTE